MMSDAPTLIIHNGKVMRGFLLSRHEKPLCLAVDEIDALAEGCFNVSGLYSF